MSLRVSNTCADEMVKINFWVDRKLSIYHPEGEYDFQVQEQERVSVDDFSTLPREINQTNLLTTKQSPASSFVCRVKFIYAKRRKMFSSSFELSHSKRKNFIKMNSFQSFTKHPQLLLRHIPTTLERKGSGRKNTNKCKATASVQYFQNINLP